MVLFISVEHEVHEVSCITYLSFLWDGWGSFIYRAWKDSIHFSWKYNLLKYI